MHKKKFIVSLNVCILLKYISPPFAIYIQSIPPLSLTKTYYREINISKYIMEIIINKKFIT